VADAESVDVWGCLHKWRRRIRIKPISIAGTSRMRLTFSLHMIPVDWHFHRDAADGAKRNEQFDIKDETIIA
jgi:hypothetical protein